MLCCSSPKLFWKRDDNLPRWYYYQCQACGFQFQNHRRIDTTTFAVGNSTPITKRIRAYNCRQCGNYKSICNCLPKRVASLRRIFKLALWCVRLMPKQHLRIVVLLAFNRLSQILPLDIKKVILNKANMLRIQPAQEPILWLHRRGRHSRKLVD